MHSTFSLVLSQANPQAMPTLRRRTSALPHARSLTQRIPSRAGIASHLPDAAAPVSLSLPTFLMLGRKDDSSLQAITESEKGKHPHNTAQAAPTHARLDCLVAAQGTARQTPSPPAAPPAPWACAT